MTHNVVAQFSTSLDGSGNFKEYKAVNGSVFNEEYNETLDSSTLVLSQVPKEDRLSYIKSYDFVRIVDKYTYNSSTGEYDFDKIYLIDNFHEKENNINEHIFSYTINLMSETKILEKFQCPNTTITHDVVNGEIKKKTIFKCIKDYMELYVPKMKFSSDGINWSYEPVVKLDGYTETHVALGNVSVYASDFVPKEVAQQSTVRVSYTIDYTIYGYRTNEISALYVFNSTFSFDVTNLNRYCLGIFIEDVDLGTYNSDFVSKSAYFMISGNQLYIYFEGVVKNGHDVFDISRTDIPIYFDVSAYLCKYFEAAKKFAIPVDVDLDKIEHMHFEDDVNTLEVKSNYMDIDEINRNVVLHVINDTGNFEYTITPGNTVKVLVGSTAAHNYKNVFYDYYTITDPKWDKFDVTSADLAFTAPHLRQLLTTLMTQLGCIPTVKNRKLGYLDFQKEAVQFGNGDYTINNTVNFITRSLSSDSFVNTLVNMSSGVLDSGNEVISEVLGFRNRTNAILKQTELRLETRLPIYKVNKFVMHYLGQGSISFPSIGKVTPPDGQIPGSEYVCALKDYVTDNKNSDTELINQSGFQLVEMGQDANNNSVAQFNHLARGIYGGGNLDGVTIQVDAYPYKNNGNGTYSAYYVNGQRYYKSVSYTVTNQGATVVNRSIAFTGTGHDATDALLVVNVTFQYIDNDGNTQVVTGMKLVGSTFNVSKVAVSSYQIDITPLLVENSVRSLLDADFLKMIDEYNAGKLTTIEDLGKYIYGTVGYSIGSTAISGFSDIMNIGGGTGLGWIQQGRLYIENIIDFLNAHSFYQYTQAEMQTLLDQYDLPYIEDKEMVNGFKKNLFEIFRVSPYTPTGVKNYSTLTFDITYQPLNSFNLSYVKTQEDIDFPLEQYDGNASGLTDFDRLSIHEQEQVDRVGNETLFISQRTTNYADIQTFENGPLYYEDDTNRSGAVDSGDKGIRYIIFKRSFSINNNCFNVSYIGSKDAVLKDYFTSIRTKYRAYEYVDYNNSVLRKCKDLVYVRVDEHFYDGDDKIWFGPIRETGTIQGRRQLSLRLGTYLVPAINGGDRCRIKYACEYGLNNVNAFEQAKNDLSIVCTRNMMSLIYEMPDNVGNGPYIANEDFSTAADTSNTVGWVTKVGGIPQRWQVWSEAYEEMHNVFFTSYIDFFNDDETLTPKTVINTPPADLEAAAIDSYKHLSKIPVVDFDIMDIMNDNNIRMWVVDKNDGTNFYKTFYKDGSERINHTVQFIYYCPSGNVQFTELFMKTAPIMLKEEDTVIANGVIVNPDNESLDTNLHNVTDTVQNPANYIDVRYYGAFDTFPSIHIEWGAAKVLKLCYVKRSTVQGADVQDIALFKKPEGAGTSTDFFITLNDTKTDYVMAEKNGILYRGYKVKLDQDQLVREVDSL